MPYQSDAVLDHPRALGFKNVVNARDLGTYTTPDALIVEPGSILRTGCLDSISDEETRILLDDYELSLIVDMRTSTEMARRPDKSIGGVERLEIHVLDEDDPNDTVAQGGAGDPIGGLLRGIESGQVCEEMYVDIVDSAAGAKAYRAMFERILDLDGGTVLLHCTAGKDRTGIACALLLEALGLSRKVIMDDYLLTNVFLADHIRSVTEQVSLLSNDKRVIKWTPYVAGVAPFYLQKMWGHFDINYGSTLDFLKTRLGIDALACRQLRQSYLF